MMLLIIWLIVWFVSGAPAVLINPPNIWGITLVIFIIAALWK